MRSAPGLSAFAFLADLSIFKMCRARRPPGRVPKELAGLTKLTTLQLHNNKLQVPEGAPTDSDGDMFYHGREEVAAFQAHLK